VFTRYHHVRSIIEPDFEEQAVYYLNKIALVLGFLSAFGVSLVGNFQVRKFKFLIQCIFLNSFYIIIGNQCCLCSFNWCFSWIHRNMALLFAANSYFKKTWQCFNLTLAIVGHKNIFIFSFVRSWNNL